MKQDDDAIVTVEKKKGIKLHPHVITGLISVGVLMLGYVFFVRPAQQTLRELGTLSSADLQNNIDQKKQRIVRMERIIADASEFPVLLEQQLERGLPIQPNLEDALVNVTSLMQTSGLEVKGVAFSEERPSDLLLTEDKELRNVREIQAKINVEQLTYTSLKRFFSNAERSLRLMRVDKLTFDVGQTSGIIDVVIFYLP